MRVLAERLAACRPAANCGEDVQWLGGLTRLDGYLLDAGDDVGDVILFGRSIEGEPMLDTDVLVVVLANLHHVYAERRGNTIYYSPIAVSIDPDPKAFAALDRIDTGGSPEIVEASWRRTCAASQATRVEGMPQSSRIADTLLRADYILKDVSFAGEELGLEGFMGIPQIRTAMVTKAFHEGRHVQSLPTMNRFWLAAGETLLRAADNGVVRLDRAEVILMTEQQALDRRGNLADTVEHDPVARAWARDFTTRFDAIAAVIPKFMALQRVFEIAAIAASMSDRDVFRAAGLDLDPLLRTVSVGQLPVPEELPGRSDVRHYSVTRDIPGGQETMSSSALSCGGVVIDFADTMRVQNDNGGGLTILAAALLSARPDVRSYGWPF